MRRCKPVSVEEAREKALPLLLAGYERRGRMRNEQERARRAAVKVERDDQDPREPRIFAL